MIIRTTRLILRDVLEGDRAAFVAYQMDPLYLRLYDFGDDDDRRAHDLFDKFLSWQKEPRENFQLDIFEKATGRLCGGVGLRLRDAASGTAVLGIELAPDDWGRYRLAIETAGTLIDHGFAEFGLERIVGNTASGNRRVERLARWFGARIVARRPGPEWMAARGWQEVAWALTRQGWADSGRRSQFAGR
jgi:ribosomal-protein-alanine N-acetyltransferase